MKMSKFNGKTIGQIIKEKREEKGWTQQYLANKIGVTRDMLAHWEVNRNNPRVDNLINLADIFNCSLDDMVGRLL